MAFTQQNVNYAATYSEALGCAFPYISYFSDIWNSKNSKEYKPTAGKTLYIPSLTTSGAIATERDEVTGAFSRNWNNNAQAVSLEMDREWSTMIDPMDIEETSMIEMIGNITKTFNEQQKIPEMDAYLASKLYSFATPDTAGLTSTTILTKWDGYLENMTNARANRNRVHAYMTPAIYRLLKQAAGLTRSIGMDGDGTVNRNVSTLDGVIIHEVPAELMKSAYNFSEGWTPTTNAVQVNLILVDLDAIAAPVKHDVCMLSEPSAQTKGKWLYYERYYYGAFKLNTRAEGIVVNASAS